ncbi:MAG: TetR family transcriptional regulator [Actinomycetota bacterium]
MAYPRKLEPAAIASATLRVLEHSGWADWSLRDVAAELGVHPNALYRHVDGKDGLLIAGGAAAARQLAAAIDVEPTSNADADVLAMVRNYVQFATQRPGAYAAFVRAKPAPDHPSFVAWADLWAMVVMTTGRAAPSAAEAAAFSLWAAVHGRCDLTAGPAAAMSAEAGLDDAVAALLGGYRSLGDVATPVPADAVRPRAAEST